MRVLAVDPGAKRLGLAISDPTGTIANPMKVLKHVSRRDDAAEIVRIAAREGAGRIIIGQAINSEGEPTFEGRRAARLAGAVRAATNIPVELWDESETTKQALAAQTAMGISPRKRRKSLDHLAATVLLQSYLDAHRQTTGE